MTSTLIASQKNRFKIDSLGVALNASSPTASRYMNLNSDQYLIVGERFDTENGYSQLNTGPYASNIYSFWVDAQGVAINSKLNQRNATVGATDAALFIDGNVYVTGTIRANNWYGTNGTNDYSSNYTNLWSLSSNATIYYDAAVTIGNASSAASSMHPFLIDKSAHYDVSKTQFAIQNLNAASVHIGILGASNSSPATVHTPANVALQFLIGQTPDDVNALYSSNYTLHDYQTSWTTDYFDKPNYSSRRTNSNILYPSLQISAKGNVGIHTSIDRIVDFTVYSDSQLANVGQYIQFYAGSSQVTANMILDVNGPMFAQNILMTDFYDNRIKSLDEIFYRKQGVSFPASNILPGSFAHGGFTFPANLQIGPGFSNNQNNVYSLDVNGFAQISSNLYVRDSVKVSNEVITPFITANYGLIRNDLEVHDRLIVDAGIFVKIPTSSNVLGSNIFNTYIYGSNINGWSNVLWLDASNNILGSNLHISGLNPYYINNISFNAKSLGAIKNEYFVDDPLFTESAFDIFGNYIFDGNANISGIQFTDAYSNIIGSTQDLSPIFSSNLIYASNAVLNPTHIMSNVYFDTNSIYEHNYFYTQNSSNVTTSNFLDNNFIQSWSYTCNIGQTIQGPFYIDSTNTLVGETMTNEVIFNYYSTMIDWLIDSNIWSSNLPFSVPTDSKHGTISLLGGEYSVFTCNVVFYEKFQSIQYQVSDPGYSNINQFGNGMATPGRWGVGVSALYLDSIRNQTTINKIDGSIYQIELTDNGDPLNALIKAAFIGHQTIDQNNSIDSGSLIFMTPDMNDPTYRTKNVMRAGQGSIPQNMYFLPGYDTFNKKIWNDTALDPSLALMGDENKFVGIHTKTPQYTLDVNGDIRFTGTIHSADKQLSFLERVNYNYFPVTSTDSFTQLYITPVSETSTTYVGMSNGSSNFEKTTRYALTCNIQYYEQLSFSGAVYSDKTAPHVGINTNADNNYGMAVSGGIVSFDGYFSAGNFKLGEWYALSSDTVTEVPTTINTPLYTYSKVGIGAMSPNYNLEILNPDASEPTTVCITASTDKSTLSFDLGFGKNLFWNWDSTYSTRSMELNFKSMTQTFSSNNATNQTISWTSNLTTPQNVSRDDNQALSIRYNYAMGANGGYQVGINTTSPSYSNGPLSYNPACLINGDLHVLGAVNAHAYMFNGQIIMDARTSTSTSNFTNSSAQSVQVALEEDDIFIGGQTIYIQPTNCLAIGFNQNNQSGSSISPTSLILDPQNSSSFVLYDSIQTYHPIAKLLTASPEYYLELGQSDISNRIRFSYRDNNFSIISASSDIVQSDAPYINFKTATSGTTNYYQTSLNSKTIYNTTASFEVFDMTGGANYPTMSLTTRLTDVTESSDRQPSLHFFKSLPTPVGTDFVSWNIQGPTHIYNDKLSFIYNRTFASSGNYTTPLPVEMFTFANIAGTPCLGIGNTEPTYSIDIYANDVAHGGIRLINNSVNAGPQLLFETKTTNPAYQIDYGTDPITSDYSLYSCNSYFNVDRRNNNVTQPILSVSAMGQIGLGMQPTGNKVFDLEINGVLNVTGGIYVDGKVAFTTSNSTQDNIITGQNVLINANYLDITPFMYGIGAAPTNPIGGIIIGTTLNSGNTSNLVSFQNPIYNDPSTAVFITYANDCHIDLYCKPSWPTDSSIPKEFVGRMGIIGNQVPNYANFTPIYSSNTLYFEMQVHDKTRNDYVDKSHKPYETVLYFTRDNSISTSNTPFYNGTVQGTLNATSKLSSPLLTDGYATLTNAALSNLKSIALINSSNVGYLNSPVQIISTHDNRYSSISLATGPNVVQLISGAASFDLVVNSNLIASASNTIFDVKTAMITRNPIYAQNSNVITFSSNGFQLNQSAQAISLNTNIISSAISLTSNNLNLVIPLTSTQPITCPKLTDHGNTFSLSNGLLTVASIQTVSQSNTSLLTSPTIMVDMIHPLTANAITFDSVVINSNLTVLGSQVTINSTIRESHQLYVSNVCAECTAVIIDQEAPFQSVLDVQLRGISKLTVNSNGTVGINTQAGLLSDTLMKLHVVGGSLFEGTINVDSILNGSLQISNSGLSNAHFISSSNIQLSNTFTNDQLTIKQGGIHSANGIGVNAPALGSNCIIGNYLPFSDVTSYLQSSNASTAPLSIVNKIPCSSSLGQAVNVLTMVRGDTNLNAVRGTFALAKTQLNGTVSSRVDLIVANANTSLSTDQTCMSWTYTNNQSKPQPMVGIGTTNPNFTLDVNGDVNITGNYYHTGTTVNMANSLIIDPGTMYLMNPTIILNGYTGIGVATAPADSSNTSLDVTTSFPSQRYVARFSSCNIQSGLRLTSASNALDIQLNQTGLTFGYSNTSTSSLQNGIYFGSNNTIAFGANIRTPTHTLEAQTQQTQPSIGLVSVSSNTSWTIGATSNLVITNDTKGITPLQIDNSGNFLLNTPLLQISPINPARAASWGLSNVYDSTSNGVYNLGIFYNGSNFANFFGSVSTTSNTSNVGGMAIGATSRKNDSLLTVTGAISAQAYNSFTGSHEVRFDHSDFQQAYVGMIVYATGNYAAPIDIDTTIPIVKIATLRQDSRVYGIISHLINYSPGNHTLLVNALGEGAMWVCNINGNIKNGDYICSSTAPGYGMLQKDDLFHSYTVAKATQSINFETSFTKSFRFVDPYDREIKEVRCAYIGVSYHTA